MSEPVYSSVVYAIDDSAPPQTWVSVNTTTATAAASGNSSTPPPGFTAVPEEVYRDAVRQQNAAYDRLIENVEYQRRVDLSSQRQQLVESGMTPAQAQILIPDPLGDYSIDNWE